LTIRFETYEKTFTPKHLKIIRVIIIVSGLSLFLTTTLLSYQHLGFLKYFSLSGLFIFIAGCITYGIMSSGVKKFIANGNIDFNDEGILVKSADSEFLIRKEDIISLTIFMDSYEGQEEPSWAARGNVLLDGLRNKIYIDTANRKISKQFYIGNRGQIIGLKRILNEWKNAGNIGIHFTNRYSENCMKTNV